MFRYVKFTAQNFWLHLGLGIRSNECEQKETLKLVKEGNIQNTSRVRPIPYRVEETDTNSQVLKPHETPYQI